MLQRIGETDWFRASLLKENMLGPNALFWTIHITSATPSNQDSNTERSQQTKADQSPHRSTVRRRFDRERA